MNVFLRVQCATWQISFETQEIFFKQMAKKMNSQILYFIINKNVKEMQPRVRDEIKMI